MTDVPVNPLYQRGHERVGCYPCIFSRKEEIALIAQHAPGRIDEIRELEAEMTALRARRNDIEPGRYKHPIATFFQTRDRGEASSMGIDEIVTWARTSRGGRQLPLLAEPPSGGCFRWGLCEPPSREPKPDEIPAALVAEIDAIKADADRATDRLHDEMDTLRERHGIGRSPLRRKP